MFDKLSFGVALLDADGKFAAANRRALDLFGGYGLPTLRNHPALRKALSARASVSTDLTHHSRQTRHSVHVVPVNDGILIEAVDTTAVWNAERKAVALRQDFAVSDAAHEELMCAYEQLVAAKEYEGWKLQEHKHLIEQLFATNAELLLLNRTLARRLAELNTATPRHRP